MPTECIRRGDLQPKSGCSGCTVTRFSDEAEEQPLREIVPPRACSTRAAFEAQPLSTNNRNGCHAAARSLPRLRAGLQPKPRYFSQNELPVAARVWCASFNFEIRSCKTLDCTRGNCYGSSTIHTSRRAAGESSSATLPSSITRMRSESMMVLSRCAIVSTVQSWKADLSWRAGT